MEGQLILNQKATNLYVVISTVKPVYCFAAFCHAQLCKMQMLDYLSFFLSHAVAQHCTEFEYLVTKIWVLTF